MTARHSTYRLHEAMPQTANGLGGFLHHVRGHDQAERDAYYACFSSRASQPVEVAEWCKRTMSRVHRLTRLDDVISGRRSEWWSVLAASSGPSHPRFPIARVAHQLVPFSGATGTAPHLNANDRVAVFFLFLILSFCACQSVFSGRPMVTQAAIAGTCIWATSGFLDADYPGVFRFLDLLSLNSVRDIVFVGSALGLAISRIVVDRDGVEFFADEERFDAHSIRVRNWVAKQRIALARLIGGQVSPEPSSDQDHPSNGQAGTENSELERRFNDLLSHERYVDIEGLLAAHELRNRYWFK